MFGGIRTIQCSLLFEMLKGSIKLTILDIFCFSLVSSISCRNTMILWMISMLLSLWLVIRFSKCSFLFKSQHIHVHFINTYSFHHCPDVSHSKLQQLNLSIFTVFYSAPSMQLRRSSLVQRKLEYFCKLCLLGYSFHSVNQPTNQEMLLSGMTHVQVQCNHWTGMILIFISIHSLGASVWRCND
jgi:hypothetical protein